MSIRALRRSTAAALSLVMVAGVVSAVTAAPAAAGGHKPLTAQQERVVKGGNVPSRPSVPDPADARALREPPPAPKWPKAASVDVPTNTRFDPKAPRPHQVGDLPVQVSASADAAARPDRVRVSVVDAGGTKRADRAEVLLRVARADGGTSASTVELAVDYRAFRTAYGADWSNRLRLVKLPECALSTPEKYGCAGTPVASRNLSTGWVIGPVTAASPDGELYALSASASGSTGSFSATDLSPSSTWSTGGSSGDFTWSYPLRTPPGLGGPTPSLSLNYSAQSVDGRHAATNNQPSWIGEGFEFWSGAIERRYKGCAEDLGGNNGQTKTGDLCWGTHNALLTLGGKSTELIYDAGTYRPRLEDGTRVEHLTNTSTGNGDNNGEHWRVTTPDGTQYYFGLNRLPGWTSGAATTRSTWTVPVYGNNSGEPCHASTFDASYCIQAWKWNLDYVVDTRGSTMSFWYAPETNKYARNLTGSKVSTYTRGGTLTRIDYGTRKSTAYGIPPMRVVFGTADRCLSNCTTHGANWPDTPWDQHCASTATSCDDFSPTFWITKRLSKITTQVVKSEALTDVESWTLKHTFPDPGDTTRAGLWLDAISHPGVPSDVEFVGIQMENRVDTSDFAAAMNWWRIAAIRTEYGGDIGVTYSAKDCVAGSRVPTSPESNKLRCYPSKWIPDGKTEPVQDYFHKYVAELVYEKDLSGGGTQVTTDYVYEGSPAWHYTDEDGLLPKSQKTWSVWRGYGQVKVVKGTDTERSVTETRYFRGMHGDKLPSGTRSVSVADSEGGTQTDHDAFAGQALEEIAYNGVGGPIIEGTIYTPWQSEPTATRTIDGFSVHARYVKTQTERSRTALDGNRGWRRTRVETTFDSYGMPKTVNDLGDEAKTGDEQCTRSTYVRNTTAWLMSYRSRVQIDALACDKTATSGDDVISDERMYYDNQAFGAAPIKGDVTKAEAFDGWVDGAPTYYAMSRAVYDGYGRVVESYDPENHRSTAAFTPASGGPIVRTTITNPLGHTTTTDYDPAFGMVTKISDPNNRITELAYDSLGRLTKVWLPGRSRASQAPNTIYAYRLPTRQSNGQPDGVVAVSTTSLTPNDTYVTSHDLYDGLLRPRQTQDPAGDGSGDRIISDTFYDTAGRAYKVNNGYFTSGAPSTTLFAPAQGDLQIESQTLTLFDDAGRPTDQILRRLGVEQWRTTTAYGGDRTDVIPPIGGTVTSTVTDARGNTVELRQYQGRTPTGTYDATTYTYNRKNQLVQITDPAGNAWKYGYDPRGRKNVTDDPDKGTNRLTFNNLNQVLTTTDSRQRTLAYSYDGLGRKTAMFDGSTAGLKLAEWTYDTVTGGLGMPASATRFVGTDEYRSEVTGYDIGGRPTGTTIEIPTAEGKLAGTYTFKSTYNADGSLATTAVPGVGGLPKEVIGYEYDDLGKPVKLTNSINLVLGTYVENTQYTKYGEPGVYTMATSATDKIVQQKFTYEQTTRRLIRAESTKETSTEPLADVHYTWDPVGNITKIDDVRSGDHQCLSHDYLRRLVEAWTPAGGDCDVAPSGSALGGPAPYWHSYRYDKVGNRTTSVKHGATTAEDETTSYTYPAPQAAQPHTLLATSTAKGSGTPVTGSYRYDSTGNTVSMPGPAGQQTLTWDAEGHLATVTDASGTSSYLYDPSGNRLISRDPGGATLYLPGMELRWSKSTDTVEGTRFYQHGGQTIAQRTAAGVSWLLPDRQGTAQISVRATPDQPVTQRRQTPFGESRGAETTWPNSHGFLDGTVDPTGTTHLAAREYEASTGRFISVDPVFASSDPQQMHGYSYAGNSPVTFSDPSGLLRVGDSEGKIKDPDPPSPSKWNPAHGGGSGGNSGKGKKGEYVGKVVGTKPCDYSKYGPCTTQYRFAVYGRKVHCTAFNQVGPCFERDGYVWDLKGHRSCEKGTAFTGCGTEPRPLPDPLGYSYGTAEPPTDKQCPTPGDRDAPVTMETAWYDRPTIRASGPPKDPGTSYGGVSACYVGFCYGITIHKEGIDFVKGIDVTTILSPGPLGVDVGITGGYMSAPVSMQEGPTIEACGGVRVNGCYSTGARSGGGYWHGWGIATGGRSFGGSVTVTTNDTYWWPWVDK